MIVILTKTKTENKIDCRVSIASEGIHEIGDLHFPNQIMWTRFYGALQRGAVGLRDMEVRLDVADPNPPTEIHKEVKPNATGSASE